MEGFDLPQVGAFLSALGEVISGVLRLDPAAFAAALQIPNGGRIIYTVLFIAGLSNTLGHSGVLFANRVPRRRFLFSLIMEALILVASVLFWALSIWFIASRLFDAEQPLPQVLKAVAVAYAPLLFGFLILLPYFGNIIYHILRIWVFLAVLVGVAVTYQFDFWQTLASSALGLLLLELAVRVPFLRIEYLDRWLWRLSTGTSKQLDVDEAVAQFLGQAPKRTNQEDGEWTGS